MQPESERDSRKRKHGGAGDYSSKKRGAVTDEDRENILKMVEDEPEVGQIEKMLSNVNVM